jgi:hypothetical protein
MKRLILAFLIALCTPLLFAQSGEQQAARQARSVHLQYRNWKGPASVFYLETTPNLSSPGTYFCTIAFDGGYCGIQELADGTHIAIFSVWEPSNPHDYGANPNLVDEGIRTKMLYAGENVHIQRFGGEGTGGKSMMPYKWELNHPVYMAISVAKDGDYRTAYTCWIWDNAKQDWFRMATFSTLYNKGNVELQTPYSFVEDFRRNVKSKEVVRKATFSRLWAYNGSLWTASEDAAFTADDNTLSTIDAGPSEKGFWLATGGDTQNVTTPLWRMVQPGKEMDDSAARRLRLLTVIQEAAQVQP